MAYSLSPGVTWSEIDLTTVVPGVSTTEGAFVGEFDWGPIDTIVTISNENDLVRYFGKPSKDPTRLDQVTSFFTAANFLQYGQNLKLVRANTATIKNATDGSNTNVLIKNREDYEYNWANAQAANNAGMFAAKYPSDLANGLKVSVFPASPSSTSNNTLWTSWAYAKEFSGKPGTSKSVKDVTKTNSYDEMHVIVIDTNGRWTGVKNSVLEKFSFLSKCSDAKNYDGSSNYYFDVIADRSEYIYAINHCQEPVTQAIDSSAANWGTEATLGKVFGQSVNRANGYTVTLGSTTLNRGTYGATSDALVMLGYDRFKNSEEVDISLIMTGHHGADIVRYVIDSVVDGGDGGDDEDAGVFTPSGRKDCVVFFSPRMADVVDKRGQELTNITNFISVLNTSSNYAFMDSGWKRQYDKYNGVYRWIPLNGDIAGLCARTDFIRDPWWSPAGLNRGKVLNVAQLAWNPTKAQRDELYKMSVNPVISIRGEGTVLFGDKTFTVKPSAFDRINVRRLFIVLEKAISRASKYSLFEFNDEFTRAQFIALIEPFLRDVKGRRGIYDYRVVCDESNNTPEVIDRNEFIGDIYVKPARSINFIHLNFVAVRTGVAFSEVVGNF